MIGTHHNGPKPYRGMKLGRRRLAEAIVNGRTYTTISRMAPANEIARQLVADGVPDAPMHIYSAGLKGCLVWRSFHKAAEADDRGERASAGQKPSLPSTS